MLTIGQMSKVCGVSVKTLRHYDKIGLLRPQQINPETGYRYYEDDQIGRMLLIGRLKRYAFSLTEILNLLDRTDTTELLRQLHFQKIRLERQTEYLSVTLKELESHLEQFERTGDIMSYQNQYCIQLKEAKEQVLITGRHKMSVDEFGLYYGKLYERIAREHLTAEPVIMAIYHDSEFDPVCSDIELAIGIKEREKADFIMPPQLCAATTHKGPYSALPDAYGATLTWINANGWQMAGAPFEIYIKTQFDGLPPQEWETEVFFPVKR